MTTFDPDTLRARAAQLRRASAELGAVRLEKDADALEVLADILDEYQQSTQPGSQRPWYQRVLPLIHAALGRVGPTRTMQEQPPGGTDA